jgi:hypothetical protein
MAMQIAEKTIHLMMPKGSGIADDHSHPINMEMSG